MYTVFDGDDDTYQAWLAAHELTEDVAIERLQDFRPGRDFELIKRY